MKYLLFSLITLSSVQMNAQNQKTFLYEITLFDQFKHPSMWTEREHNIQTQHIAYLDSLSKSGALQIAGIMDQGLENHTGLIILETDDYETAKTIASNDPSVKKGMMSVRLKPIHIYFKPKEN